MAKRSANPNTAEAKDGDGEEDGGAADEDGGAAETVLMDTGLDGETTWKTTRVFAARGLAYADIVKKRKEHAEEVDMGWEKRSFPLQRVHKDEVNPFQDFLLYLCKSRGVMQGHICKVIAAATESLSLSTWLDDAMRMGVCIFFMAKSIHGLQVREWVRTLSDGADPQQVIFLGRSSFYVRCRDYKQKFSLLSKSGAWAGNLFGIPLPWEESFDPCAEFATKCPVWITLKNVPVFLLPHLEKILACMGKILHLPKLGCYVPSRNIKICVLWQLDTEIPDFLKIPVGKEEALYIQLAFEPFPLACFKCNQFGHYAKVCPHNQKAIKEASTHIKVMEAGHVNVQQQHLDGCNSAEAENGKVSRYAKESPNLMITASHREGIGKGGNGFVTSNPFSGLNEESLECKKSSNEDDVVGEGKIPSKKSKKKKVKKKKKAEAKAREAIDLETSKLYIELNSDLETEKGKTVGNGSKGELQDSEDSNNEDDACELQQPMQEQTSTEHERTETKADTEETERICFKKFFNEENQKYHIPVSTYKDQECWYIEFDGKRRRATDFFRLHNLDPGEVVLVTEKGRFGYRGS